MFLGKTKETWKQELGDCLRFLLFVACIAGACAGLTYGLAFVSGQTPRDSFQSIANFLCLYGIAYYLLQFVSNYWKRRQSLLDLGTVRPARNIRYWFFAFLIIATILFWQTPLGLSYLLLTSLWLNILFSGQFIAKGGICYRGWFVEWKNIESYAWERAATPTLKLRTKSQVLGMRSGDDIHLEIPTAHCEAVSEILERYLPGKERDDRVE